MPFTMSESSSRPLNVIIVGGGLAGLAAAGYLRAKHNVTVIVFVTNLIYNANLDIYCAGS